MLDKLAGLWPVRRVSALAVGFWETFLRDNKVIPPVLAVAALFIFSWIVVGSFIGTPDDEPVANQDEIAQSENGGGQPPAPEIENPNTDSYAAYQSKDPFRQLFETAESTTQETTTTEDDGTSDDGTSGDGADDSGDTTSDDSFDDSTDDGSQNTGGDDGTSTGNPGDGAADDQYENGRAPRDDPTDGTNDTDDTGSQTPQTPAQPTRPADPGDDLFDSGGDLEDPNKR